MAGFGSSGPQSLRSQHDGGYSTGHGVQMFNPGTTSYYMPQTTENFPVQSPIGYGNGGQSGAQNVPNYNFVPESAVTGMAMQYGSAFVGQGADYVQKSVNNYISSSRLKYYFAVNNSYVAKKLGLVLFPFAHTKWSVQFDTSGPVPPGDDINAPDLYIPLMAFVTFVLVSGAVLGIQGRFSPEQLGIVSSEALGWLLLEVLIFLLFVYVLNVQSNISYLDAIAFSGYKFVSMIVTLLSYLLLDLPGYYFSLVYLSFAIAFFLIRTLKLKVLPHAEAYSSEGNKRRVYLLLMIALVQPFLIWWMSRRMLLTPPTKPIL